MSSRSRSSGGLPQPSSNDVLTSQHRTGRKRDILAEHAKRRAAFSAAALAASGTTTATATATAEILSGHAPKRAPVRRSASNMDTDLRDVASVVGGNQRREFFNAAIAASTAAAEAAKASERQSSFLRRTVSSGDALREAPKNNTRSEQQTSGSTTAQFEPSKSTNSGSSRFRRAASSTDAARRGSTRLHPASTPSFSEADFDAEDMTLPTFPRSPPSVRRCKGSVATSFFPLKDAAVLPAGIDAPGSTQSHDWWLSGLGTTQGGGEEAKGESPDGRGYDGDISARPRNRERRPGRLHVTAAGAPSGFLPAASLSIAGARSRRSRPKSLGSRTLSQSSFDEAIRVQEQIDQAIEAEEMQSAIGRRRDRKGLKERSTTAGRAGNNREAQRQPRCFSRSRSSQQEGFKLEPRAEEEEEGEWWQPVRRPLSSLTTASSTTRRGNRAVSTKGHKKEEAGEGLRRSLSTGSALLPRTSESRDGVDENQTLRRQQQQQQQRNSRQRERAVVRREDEAAEMEIENRSDTQGFRAGRGGVFSSVAMNTSPSVSARSKGRSQRRSGAAKREKRGGHIGQRPATPEAQPAEDAATAAASAASAATSAAASAAVAADAAAAAMETAGVLFAEEPLSSPSASPPVWVARHLDCSDSHGLVFLMSDGSVGLLFKDHTKMVVDPAGVTFDYVEPPWSSSTAAVALQALTSSIHEAESGAGGGEESVRHGNGDARDRRHQPQQRYQYSLDHFPFYLRKKVKALRFVWESLLSDNDGGADGGGEANTSREALARQRSGTSCTARTVGNRSSEWAAERQELHHRQTLTFIEKWQRAGDTHWFQLSDQTIQVGEIESDGASFSLFVIWP